MKKILEFNSKTIFFIAMGLGVALIISAIFTYIKGGTIESFDDLNPFSKMIMYLISPFFLYLIIKHLVIPMFIWIYKFLIWIGGF